MRRVSTVKQFLLGSIFMLSNIYWVYGQDINFSQFYELPLLRNPALAGIYKGDIKTTTAFRNQWENIVPYQTQAIAVETKFPITPTSDDYISIGMQMTNDVAGDGRLGKTQLLPVFAFHKIISYSRNTYLTAGFIGGGASQRFDPTRLRFDDQFINGAYSSTNPTAQSFTNTSINYWDGALGLSLSSDFGNNRYYIGGAYFHFNKPKVAFTALNDIRLNPKFVLNAGLSIATSEVDFVTFYGDFFAQGGNRMTQAGAIFKHTMMEGMEDQTLALSLGGFYRWNDAFIPLVKLDYYNLALGLTYDININRLRSASQFRGGYELTLSYKSFLNIRKSSLDKIKCLINFY